MTKKQKVPKGAGLTTIQKIELKTNILKEFPECKMFEEEIDFLIEQYSEKNKDIATEIYDRGTKQFLESRGHKQEEDYGEFRTFGAEDFEYTKIMEKFKQAEEDFKRRQDEIAEKAIEEMKAKGITLDEDIKVKNIQITTEI